MAQQRIPPGGHGEIRNRKVGAGRWEADTLVRDMDGRKRRIERSGPTKTAAWNSLQEALRDRDQAGSGDGLKGSSLFAEAAALWLVEIEHGRKATTFDTYRRNLNHRVLPAFGELTLRECDNVARVHRYLRSLERDAGLSANMVRSCRNVLSGVLALAAQHDAIGRNPVRDAGRVEGGRSRARALTAAERVDFIARLDADPRAVEDDLPALVRYMLATGVRLGEALGLRWFRVDLEQGLVVHGDNLVTVVGKGSVLQTPKSRESFRVLPLADFALDMLRFRYPGTGLLYNPVFPNTRGTWRDRNNTMRSLRKFRQANPEYGWVTSHVFRKTAITIMDQSGMTPRAIAGFAGHSRPSITMDSYMDKRPEDRAGAAALDAAMRIQ